MAELRPFHRFFSLSWVDFCEGSDIAVETELDMSLKQQFIDLVLTWKGDKPLTRRLPDGFDNLSRFNLVTFKSHQEALDWFALCELLGHFVNYRKQFSHRLTSCCRRASSDCTRCALDSRTSCRSK
jgi:hypothetical protein